MKILIIGSGGREHAIAWKLHQEGHELFCIPGNAGTQALCLPITPLPSTDNLEGLVDLAVQHRIGLTVVGPEAPLADGITDLFQSRGLKVFGPTQRAAQLETSKAFAKTFMERHNVPTARYRVCHDLHSAHSAIVGLMNASGVVVKASGLCAGKGVSVCTTEQEALKAAKEIIGDKRFGDAGNVLVIEERLVGTEVSIQLFCDGKDIALMPPAQDHKRLLTGDHGPNTGGMGAFAPTPFYTPELGKEVYDTIILRTLEGLKRDGTDYRGVLYIGLIITSEGPKVLEYNCRFGDPETQVVLPLLESDLSDTLLACVNGDLGRARPEWRNAAASTVVLASAGYPGTYQKGKKIEGLATVTEEQNLTVFHAGSGTGENGTVVTTGGRVLAVTGTGPTLADAIATSYKGVSHIWFEGCQYRTDIGQLAKQLSEELATI